LPGERLSDEQLAVHQQGLRGDIPTIVRPMKGGAVDFLPKPSSEREILAAVAAALERSRAGERERREIESLRARYEALTAREREVFALVVAGLLNKVIADRLGIQEATIKVHRGRVMEKMGAASLADLVRMSERLGIAPGAALEAAPDISGNTTKVAYPGAARRRTLAPCSRRTAPNCARESRLPRHRAKRAAVLPRR
jgi:DNA-binding CsgD family transcriptional regulator